MLSILTLLRNSNSIRILLTVCAVFLIIIFSIHAARAVSEKDKQVILITVDKITWDDIESNAGFLLSRFLEGKGAAPALMNNATAGSKDSSSAYVTIGAGSRAVGLAEGRVVQRSQMQSDDKDLFFRYNDYDLPQGEIFYLYPQLLQAKNSEQSYPLLIGALGETLIQHGLGQAVIGSSGVPGEGCDAVSLAMDSQGSVEEGDLFGSAIRDYEFAGGWKTDPILTWNLLQSAKSSLVVIEWGDTTRIEAERDKLTPGRRKDLLKESFSRLDQFLAMLLEDMENRLLILVVPSPPDIQNAEGGLTPVLMAGKDIPGGMLTSGSTRSDGIVTNLDIAPTILSYLEIKQPYYMQGQPLEVKSVVFDRDYFGRKINKIAALKMQRAPVLRTYVILQIFALAVGLITIIFSPVLGKWLRALLVGLLLFPFVLLLPIEPAESVWGTGIILTAVLVLVTVIIIKLFSKNMVNVLTAISFLTVLTILADQLFLNGVLIKNSFLGYDFISGARYYGLGNEYMGVLIGAFPLAAASLFEKLHKTNWVIFFLLIVWAAIAFFVLASPQYGANFGGSLSALTGFSTLVILLMGYKLNPTVIGITMTVILVGVILIFELNNPIVESSSHLGRALGLISVNGIQSLWDMILRKLSMNLMLLRYSLWSKVLLFALAVLLLLFYRPVGVIRQVFQRYPFLFSGMASAFVGSITALLVNDSGVVAAATAMLFVILPLLFLLTKEREKTI